MSKLKCWEKVGENTWYSKVLGQKIITKKEGVILKEIEADDQYSPKSHWAVFEIKKTKNKSQSLKFANEYMKDHDRC